MHQAAPNRIAALDLIRGVAVLGILAVNIDAFFGPPFATLTPNWPVPADGLGKALFAGSLLLFEGKMRLLFTVLFGASMVLFIERANAQKGDGPLRQLKRLIWLLALGYLHYILLWWGDILAMYAVIGFLALAFHHGSARLLATIALPAFLIWHSVGMAGTVADLTRDHALAAGHATSAEREAERKETAAFQGKTESDFVQMQRGLVKQAQQRATTGLTLPISTALSSLGETLPLMLLGMALYKAGFFSGQWSRQTLRSMAALGIGMGGVLTTLQIAWAWSLDFPVVSMFAFSMYWTAIPHLLMGLGYAALLVLAAPRLSRSAIGQRFEAAGRMAFSNYVATSLVMTAIFYGWGMGLAGEISRNAMPLFVLAMWLAILGWSQPWLSCFRQGPLEWLWRSLTEGQLLAFRR